MSVQHLWTCDRCGIEERGPASPPKHWARADIRFHDLPKMGSGQLLEALDLCEPCQDSLKKTWSEWRNSKVGWPPIDAERTTRHAAAAVPRVEWTE